METLPVYDSEAFVGIVEIGPDTERYGLFHSLDDEDVNEAMLYRMVTGLWVYRPFLDCPSVLPEHRGLSPSGRLVTEAEAIDWLLREEDQNYLAQLLKRDWFRKLHLDRGARKELKLTKDDLALAILSQHPDWTDAAIADYIGVHRSTVSRMKGFQRVRAAQREDRDSIRRGHRLTGGGVEASDWQGPEELADWESDKSD